MSTGGGGGDGREGVGSRGSSATNSLRFKQIIDTGKNEVNILGSIEIYEKRYSIRLKGLLSNLLISKSLGVTRPFSTGSCT